MAMVVAMRQATLRTREPLWVPGGYPYIWRGDMIMIIPGHSDDYNDWDRNLLEYTQVPFELSVYKVCPNRQGNVHANNENEHANNAHVWYG